VIKKMSVCAYDLKTLISLINGEENNGPLKTEANSSSLLCLAML